MEAVIFPDPVAATIAYLGEITDGELSIDGRPDDHRGLWVEVVDAGGSTVEQVRQDVRVHVEVSHEDAEVASLEARRLDAALRACNGVGLHIATISTPHYDPDPDMRVPVYTMTHTLRFRGEPVTLP